MADSKINSLNYNGLSEKTGLVRIAPAFLALLLASAAAPAADGPSLEAAANDVDNVQSLQRGARNFMNYCSGCHSARYVRFNTIARGLGVTEDQVINNLMFNADKTFETIESSMRAEDARRWFGQAPPDVSLIARAKSTDYVYNYLKSFYVDPDSPTGVDNRSLAGTAMPHVLWELQGYQKANFREEPIPGQDDGASRLVFDSFEQMTVGTMGAQEFGGFVRDTANFLEYIAQPERSTRRKLGVWVLIFLTFFLIVAQMLKKQIWKDVN